MSRLTPGCLPDGRTRSLANADEWTDYPSPSDLACDDCGGDHAPGGPHCAMEVDG